MQLRFSRKTFPNQKAVKFKFPFHLTCLVDYIIAVGLVACKRLVGWWDTERVSVLSVTELEYLIWAADSLSNRQGRVRKKS